MHALGVLLDQQGESGAALQLFERRLAIWQELDDREMQARELNSLGIAHRHLGDLPSTPRRHIQAWEAETAAGRALSQQDALTLLLAATPHRTPVGYRLDGAEAPSAGVRRRA